MNTNPANLPPYKWTWPAQADYDRAKAVLHALLRIPRYRLKLEAWRVTPKVIEECIAGAAMRLLPRGPLSSLHADWPHVPKVSPEALAEWVVGVLVREAQENDRLSYQTRKVQALNAVIDAAFPEPAAPPKAPRKPKAPTAPRKPRKKRRDKRAKKSAKLRKSAAG